MPEFPIRAVQVGEWELGRWVVPSHGGSPGNCWSDVVSSSDSRWPSSHARICFCGPKRYMCLCALCSNTALGWFLSFQHSFLCLPSHSPGPHPVSRPCFCWVWLPLLPMCLLFCPPWEFLRCPPTTTIFCFLLSLKL